ncbi:hypothetical protein L218DRAFT_998471 [Marasmius fiardii PR-910]|nr:hypothetical protein L218DRAFT_998471 [Marasmius fiardii PR-910]
MSNSAKSPSYSGSGALIAVFIAIHTFVWVGSCILLLTVALSSNIRRHAIWVNMKLSWTFSCFAFALLFTTGQLYKSEPVFAICLIQAAAVASVPILCYLRNDIGSSYISTGSGPDAGGKISRARATALVCVPYILPTGVFILLLVLGLQERPHVTLAKDWMLPAYISHPNYRGQASNIAVVIILLPTVIIEGLTITSVYRMRHVLGPGPTSLSTLIRLSVFTLFGIFGLIISFVSNYFKTTIQTALGNVLQSLTPLSFILLFGLQRDILRTWAFWRRSPREVVSMEVGSNGTTNNRMSIA